MPTPAPSRSTSIACAASSRAAGSRSARSAASATCWTAMKIDSLRIQLLCWLLLPLAGIAALNIWLTYHSADHVADTITDRTLIASARPIAEQTAVTQGVRSEEHTSELQSLMRISSAVLCLNKNK